MKEKIVKTFAVILFGIMPIFMAFSIVMAAIDLFIWDDEFRGIPLFNIACLLAIVYMSTAWSWVTATTARDIVRFCAARLNKEGNK